MNFTQKITLLGAHLLCGAWPLLAQTPKDSVATPPPSPKPAAKPVPELKFKFNSEGTLYAKLGFGSQLWTRVIENNPGTMVNGVPQATTYDVGIRRMRIFATMHLSTRYLLYIQMGTNNQSFISGGGTGTGTNGAGKKAPFFFHDVYNQFTIVPALNEQTQKANPFVLYSGIGLHSWNGVSRLSSASAWRLLTLDTPVFNFNTIEVSDQFSRQFGIFAHGEWNRFLFRFNANKPFATNLKPTVGGGAVDNNQGGKPSFAGYVDYQFLDKETRQNPFTTSSYLGKKKMLNVGAGFYTNQDGTMSQPTADQTRSHDIKIWAADLFMELPFGKKSNPMSFNLYSVLYNYNFGPNYLRTTAVMNAGVADPNFKGAIAKEGFGNAKYLLGTGKVWYTQAGLLLPKFSEKVRLQPYVTYAVKNLDALAQKGTFYDLGTNFLIDGHNAKISVQYSNRPLYSVENNRVFKRAGEVLTCVQLHF
ncbi:hypothetical protein SAMN05421780_102438 [Flexibacter flexilis DSM 6793]|uniref:Short chain amide porin n=1 Tax=Flexibacter flexilis DSM 6793 TaxID=927664 RepID=A0A1I1G4E5_9BACT|nr:hypothetical protein [Flexibacter flexilis]SFC06182.1 hypothetical protein SAMN05421780_102438 [Flexibacter flexilis DSM 6793]